MTLKTPRLAGRVQHATLAAVQNHHKTKGTLQHTAVIVVVGGARAAPIVVGYRSAAAVTQACQHQHCCQPGP